MRSGQNKRVRGRNHRRGPNPLTRSYESNGPDVKVRGTAQHVAEKYTQLARDAHAASDPVMAESYLQHAEHYYRIIALAHQAQIAAQNGNAEEREEDEDDFDVGTDRFSVRSLQPPASSVSPRDSRSPEGEGEFVSVEAGENTGELRPLDAQEPSERWERAPRQDRGDRNGRPDRGDNRGDRNGRGDNRGGRQDRPRSNRYGREGDRFADNDRSFSEGGRRNNAPRAPNERYPRPERPMDRPMDRPVERVSEARLVDELRPKNEARNDERVRSPRPAPQGEGGRWRRPHNDQNGDEPVALPAFLTAPLRSSAAAEEGASAVRVRHEIDEGATPPHPPENGVDDGGARGNDHRARPRRHRQTRNYVEANPQLDGNEG